MCILDQIVMVDWKFQSHPCMGLLKNESINSLIKAKLREVRALIIQAC